jgi:2-furoyl-CoA dehydrogenase FAD binding subunit
MWCCRRRRGAFTRSWKQKNEAAQMKPRPFDYVRPDTVEEAVALLAEYGEDARVLAGGQSLVPMLNLRLIDVSAMIDISRIAALETIRDLGDWIEVGAAVTQNTLLAWPQLRQKLPLVAAALPCVGHFQTRNKGTVCGSIAHADPSAELALALAVLGGEVVLRSRRGSRTLAADEFQQDMLTTARAADELITAVRFPVMAGKSVAFREVARRHGDFAIVALAAAIDDQGAMRLGVGGMAGRPVVRRINGDTADAIAEWAEELEGYEDLHASAALRRDLFRNLAPHVIAEAKTCAA